MPAWYIKALAQTVPNLCKQVAWHPSYHCDVKIISFILSLLILSMALSPCTDEPIENESVSIETHDHHEESSHNDLCSPFCTCNCCHSHVTEPCAFCLQTFVSYSSTPSDQSFLFLSRISFSIWDPPPLMNQNSQPKLSKFYS